MTVICYDNFGIILITAGCIGNLKILHSQPFAATYINAAKAGACLADGFDDHAAY